jgi:5-methylcytosine-specific restriction endonuclease McrA
MKRCHNCGEEKEEIAFRPGRRDCRECGARYMRERYAKDPKKHSAIACKWAREHPEKRNSIKRAWYNKNKARLNRARNAKTYGLTPEQVESMRCGQNGCCAICGDKFLDTPEIDHCHESGKVRALLCGLCNAGLGMFQDSLARVLLAGAYLQRFQ